MGVLVNADGVTVVHGVATVLDEVSLGVATGVRVGVVGRNGGGKSTLLRVLAGRQQPDTGRVVRAGGAGGVLRIGLLAQDDELDPGMPVRRALVGERAEHETGDHAFPELDAEPPVEHARVFPVGRAGKPRPYPTSQARGSGRAGTLQRGQRVQPA